MGTATTRYGLYKIDSTVDLVNVVIDFNNNWDSIDLKLGTQVCTSSTRPAAPVLGMQIFETDTGYTRTYNGTSWGPSETVATSTAMPANPVRGDTAYVSDFVAESFYSGSAWHYTGLTAATSAARPSGTPLTIGSEIYETDTKRLMVWNGSSWENKSGVYVCTSSTRPATNGQGLEIYESDTGMSAVYTGANWLYYAKQLAPTQFVSTTTAAITFSGIPACNHLAILWKGRGDTAATTTYLYCQLNGNTGASYTWQNVKGNGTSAATSDASTGGDTKIVVGVLTSAGSISAQYNSCGEINFPHAQDTVNRNQVSATGNAMYNTTLGVAGVYGGSGTFGAAITSIKLFPQAGNFTQGAFSLYGMM